MVKSSYREPGAPKYEKDMVYSKPPNPETEHDPEPERSIWQKLIKAGLILLAATFLYLVLIRKPPYCKEPANASQCNYQDAGFQLY